MIMFMKLQLVCAAILGCATAGEDYQKDAEKLDEAKYPPIGQMVDIGTHKLHMVEAGKEFKGHGPTVILEAGLHGDAMNWADVQSEISKYAHVVSYDRAGLGWSQEASMPRTAENIVNELHGLLQKTEVSAPYVFAGHSFGGIIAQLYAAKYPNEVAGMVLIDAAHEDMLDDTPKKMMQSWTKSENLLWLAQSAAPVGLVRYFSESSLKAKTIEMKYPQSCVDMRVANVCKTKYLRTFYDELKNIKVSFDQLKQTPRNFGDMPLTVILAGKLEDVSSYGCGHLRDYDEADAKAFIAMCHRHKQEQAARSTQGKLIVAEHSTHKVPFEQREIIIDSVREIVEKVRTK